MKTKVIVLAKTLVAVICGLGLLATIIVVTPRVRADSLATEKIITATMSYPQSNWFYMSALLS